MASSSTPAPKYSWYPPEKPLSLVSRETSKVMRNLLDSRSNTMMGVHHAGDTIETESVKVVLVHPEAKITEKEAENLVMSIVEQPAVPKLVLSFGTRMEVLVVGT